MKAKLLLFCLFLILQGCFSNLEKITLELESDGEKHLVRLSGEFHPKEKGKQKIE